VGYTDWRRPTEDELISLLDYSAFYTSPNAQVFPDIPIDSNGNYWSDSAYAGNSDYAWYVDFAHGNMCNYYKSFAYQVRLVRSVTTLAPTTTTTVATTATTTQTTAGHTLTLPIGWNLLGNGWSQSLPVATLLGDKTKITTVWKWDTTTSGWQFFTPSITAQELQNYAINKGYGVLSKIHAGEVFWVNVSQIFNLILPDSTPLGCSDFMAGKPHALIMSDP